MQTKSAFIYRSIEYLAWFLIFMLIESYANTRVGEVIGGEKVELDCYSCMLSLFVKKQEKLNKYVGWRHDDLPIL